MEYVWEYRWLVFTVFAMGIYLLASGAAGWALFKQALLALMLRAQKAAREERYGPIDGPQLMDAVVQVAMAQIVPRLPLVVRSFVTESQVRVAAQQLYNWARDWVDDGKVNGSIAG